MSSIRKLAKKSLTRDSSGGGDDVGTPTSSALRKFTGKKNAPPPLQDGGVVGPPGGPSSSGGGQSNQPFETSDGAMRLNRILDQKNATSAGVTSVLRNRNPNTSAIGGPTSPGTGIERTASTDMGGMASLSQPASPGGGLLNNNASTNNATPKNPDYVPPSTIQLADPTDEHAVGEMTCRISSKQRVDSRSIGGVIVAGDGKVEARTGNILLKEGWEEITGDNNNAAAGAAEGGKKQALKAALTIIPSRPMNRLTNECLFCMCVSQFDLSVGLSGGPSGGKKRHIPIAKTRNKLRYIVILRSTNRPLVRPGSSGRTGFDSAIGLVDDDDVGTEADDMGSDDGFDEMFNPESSDAASSASADSKPKKGSSRGKSRSSRADEDTKSKAKLYEEYDCGIPPEREISSFPALLCMAIHADGTKPDVRKILELDKLVSIENVPPRKNAPSGSAGCVILYFRNGDAVEIDSDLPNAVLHSTVAGAGEASANTPAGRKSTAIEATNRLRKDRLLWSLLQIHAILCTSVVERTAASAAMALTGAVMASSQLPPLNVRNVDRGELQYVSTVNGFLTESSVLCALLDRQSIRSRGLLAARAEEEKSSDGVEEGKSDEMDGMAYDMMMGNYNRVALFVNEEEKQDAADVLNETPWQQQEITSDGMTAVDASATADTLIRLLQKQMRDLEAETCRRLISWEDEKYYSASGERSGGNQSGQGKETRDVMSLNDLHDTLQSLDDELEKMEYWIEERATMIKPITDECRGIEEENRMLEQQWVSYETLGNELTRLLSGLVLPQGLMKVLANPGSAIVYDSSGAVDIERSEEGVELIFQAGQALKLALDTAEKEGGIHLRAVSDSVKVLTTTSNKFCDSLARIVVTVMEQLAKEVCSRQDSVIGKGDNHSSIAKKIRESQRQFQASLLAYIKIIEALALLKPDILPAVRDAYSELVAEGIMSKKRMKAYFASLPGRTSVKIASETNFDLPGRTSASVTHDLSEYTPVSLRNPITTDASGMMKPVNVEDVEAALSEMLPLIAREAYFTAQL